MERLGIYRKADHKVLEKTDAGTITLSVSEKYRGKFEDGQSVTFKLWYRDGFKAVGIKPSSN